MLGDAEGVGAAVGVGVEIGVGLGVGLVELEREVEGVGLLMGVPLSQTSFFPLFIHVNLTLPMV